MSKDHDHYLKSLSVSLKAIDSLLYPTGRLTAVNSQLSFLQNITKDYRLDSMNLFSGLERRAIGNHFFSSIDSLQRDFERYKDPFSASSQSTLDLLKSNFLESYEPELERLTNPLLNLSLSVANSSLSVFDKVLKDFELSKKPIDELLNFTFDKHAISALNKAMNEATNGNSLFSGITSSLNKDNLYAVAAKLNSFGSIERVLHSVDIQDSQKVQTGYILSNDLQENDHNQEQVEALNNKIENLTHVKDEFNFLELFSKLPREYRYYLALIALFMGFIIENALSSVIDFYIKKALESIHVSRELTPRENIKFVRSLEIGNYVDVIDYRFVTLDNLSLFDRPSTKAHVIYNFSINNVVILLEKKRNWTKVAFTGAEQGYLTGWLLTRYTKKFM